MKRPNLHPPRGEGWRPIRTAPRVEGVKLELWFVHNFAQYCDDPVKSGYVAAHGAEWIKFNGGGWTWHGLCGTATHWRPWFAKRTRALIAEAQARLDADLAAMTPWAQLGRFIDDLWADYQAELAADRRRLFAVAQRRLNLRYARGRDRYRQAFAAQMRAQGYAEVDGGAFGLVEPHGSLDLAESPE